jgi:uncharacterized phage protein (TIGR02218 family)
MKDIDTSFLSHLQSSDQKTIATAVVITSVINGNIYYLTDCFKDLTIDGNSHDSDSSYTITSIKKSVGINVDTLTLADIRPVSGSDLYDDAKRKLLEGAAIDVFIVNFQDTTQFYQDFKGYVARVKIRDNTFDIECEGQGSLLLQNVIKTYEYSCPLIFGSDACGFDTATVTVTGSVTSFTSKRKFIDTTKSQADNHFRFGILTWTSGLNNGLSKEVKSYAALTKEFILVENMPYDIAVGNTYSVYQGCNKDSTTCKAFNNFINFEGYLHLVPKAENLTYTPEQEVD